MSACRSWVARPEPSSLRLHVLVVSSVRQCTTESISVSPLIHYQTPELLSGVPRQALRLEAGHGPVLAAPHQLRGAKGAGVTVA